MDRTLRDLLESPLTVPPVMNLFHVLRMTFKEELHSNVIGWLLDPYGPFENGWLLTELLKEIGRDDLGLPLTVKREIGCGSGRVDIVVEWRGFRLIIENKINSPEGPNQCSKYLEAFEICGPDAGRLVFLTPRGKWPGSVPHGDLRVVPLGYRKLRELIQRGLDQKACRDARAQILVAEYAELLLEVEGPGTRRVRRPPLAPTSRDVARLSATAPEVIAHELSVPDLEKWDAHYRRTIEDSQRFIEWMIGEARAGIQVALGGRDVIPCESFQCAWVFRPPEWVRDGYEFGVAYSAEKSLGNEVITNYKHILGVRIQAINKREKSRHCEVAAAVRRGLFASPIRDRIIELLGPCARRTLANENNCYWAVYVPAKVDADWTEWADRIKSTLAKLAVIVAPILDSVSRAPAAR